MLPRFLTSVLSPPFFFSLGFFENKFSFHLSNLLERVWLMCPFGFVGKTSINLIFFPILRAVRDALSVLPDLHRNN